MPVTLFARKGADCLGKFAGEAERTLRLLFDEVHITCLHLESFLLYLYMYILCLRVCQASAVSNPREAEDLFGRCLKRFVSWGIDT